MPRPIEVTVEFSFPIELGSVPVSDLDCRATAKVSGSEVWAFDGIEVFSFPDGEYIDADWLERFIRDYLISGAEDSNFEQAARDALDGQRADYRRAMA